MPSVGMSGAEKKAADFDEDEDDEVAKLARQLAKQVGYNNDLIEQLTEAEAQVQAMQREKREMTARFRQADKTLRIVAADRDRFQKQRDTFEAKLAAANKEAGDRAVEERKAAERAKGASQYAHEARQQISLLSDELNKCQSQLASVTKENVVLKQAASHRDADEAKKSHRWNAEMKAIEEELAEERSRNGPLLKVSLTVHSQLP